MNSLYFYRRYLYATDLIIRAIGPRVVPKRAVL